MTTTDLPFNVTDLIRRPRITAELMSVTPAIAREWLSRNDHNRTVRPGVRRQYARDMAAGRWQVTGEPIKFSADGRLLDGQHRLLAVVDSDATVEMLIITGLADEAQDVMDTGSRRLASDMLTLSGHTNSMLLAAAVKWIVLFDEDRLYTDRAARIVTHSDIREYVEANPQVAEVATVTNGIRRHIDLQPAILAASFWIIRRVDYDDANEFMGRLADGIGLTAGSPIIALRNRLRQIKQNKTRVEPEALLSLVIRAWNAWRTGRELASLPTHKAGTQIRCPQPR